MRILSVLVLSLFFTYSSAQKKTAIVSGHVVDENDRFLPKVSVVILGKPTGIVTNDSGYFSIKVAAEKSIALIFSHTGYTETQKNFFAPPAFAKSSNFFVKKTLTSIKRMSV